MSELINKNDNRATIRWKLLTGVSALALTAYVSSAGVARAEDTDRPTVWIDLGGEMQMMHGLSDPFTAPFMTTEADIGLDKGKSFTKDQRPAHYDFGFDGKITFQPKESNWLFSASIRYGRAHAEPHVHDQIATTLVGYVIINHVKKKKVTFNTVEPFRDVNAPSSERHTVLDFSVGRDVGIGILGNDGSSEITAGVRFAEFTAKSTVSIAARPDVAVIEQRIIYAGNYLPHISFHQYTMAANAARSFKGIGPSLSWNASAALAGNEQDGEILLEWGIDAAVLFGRQRAKTNHSTQEQALHFYDTYYTFYGNTYARPHSGYPQLYNHSHHSTRTKRVTVPDFGGFVGLSYRYTDAKISIGYRYDSFLKAMDAGIDTRDASNLTFNGPYASISIGLGD